MNERIRAHDLWTQVCQEDMPELDETYMTMRRTRKFAELIVRECVSVINTEAAEHEDDDEIERAWKMGTEFAVYQIKQHFGVEE